VSLSIGTVPPAPSSNGQGPGTAAARSSGLPFDAMLDSQTDANDDEAGDVRDADPPADLPAMGVADRYKSRTPVDPVIGSLTGLPAGIRRFLVGNDEHNQDEAVLAALARNKPANEAASLLLLAVQDVVQRLESPGAPEGIGQAKSGPSKIPTGLAVDDQVLQNLLSALVDAEAASAEAEAPTGTPTPAAPSTFVTDLLTKEWSSANQSDQWRALDTPFSRPASMPPVAALVDAIRLSTGQGTFPDQDQGFNQSSTTGSDRRSSKGTAVLAIHMAEAVAGFDSAVKSSTSPVATAPPLPNEAGVVASIVQTMRLQLHEGVGTAVVHLEPDYLGAVSIALRVENGVVTASLHAENPQVRAWMEANESQLRESLASQGLTLDRLLVTDERIGEERSPDRRHQQEQEQHARQRPRRDDTTTFEVVV
jgi:flagellar hook-length control protein FliK